MKFFSGSAQHDRDNMVWQAAFERSCDAILVLSGAKIIACNEAAVRFGGFRAKADLLSRSPADIAPELQPDGRRSTDVGKDKVALAMTEGHARFEWITRRADGAHMPLQVTLVPDRDRRPAGRAELPVRRLRPRRRAGGEETPHGQARRRVRTDDRQHRNPLRIERSGDHGRLTDQNRGAEYATRQLPPPPSRSPPMCRRWPARPRNCRARLPRSIVRSLHPRRSPAKPSRRRRAPTIWSTASRRRRPRSAPSPT
jgi:hypothetical protein